MKPSEVAEWIEATFKNPCICCIHNLDEENCKKALNCKRPIEEWVLNQKNNRIKYFFEEAVAILDGFVGGLLLAWILTWFNVDSMILEVMQPFTRVKLTTSHYYVLIAMIGLAGGALEAVVSK